MMSYEGKSSFRKRYVSRKENVVLRLVWERMKLVTMSPQGDACMVRVEDEILSGICLETIISWTPKRKREARTFTDNQTGGSCGVQGKYVAYAADTYRDDSDQYGKHSQNRTSPDSTYDHIFDFGEAL